MRNGKHIGTGEHLTASCQTGALIWKPTAMSFRKLMQVAARGASGELSAPGDKSANSTLQGSHRLRAAHRDHQPR